MIMRRTLQITTPFAILAGLAWLIYWVIAPVPQAELDPLPEAPAPDPVAEPTPVRRADAGSAQWPADAPRQLFGTVTDEEGQPVEGASVRVFVRTGSTRRGRTSSRGEFRIDRVPAGAQGLEFSAHGFKARTFDRPRFPRAARVRWDVTLERADGVYGTVRCPEGPAAGAVIALDRWIPDGGEIPRQRIARTPADSEGRFAFDPGALDGLDGRFTLRARHGACGYAKLDIDGPGPVNVVLPGGGYVEGRVLDSRGRPIESFSVSASALARGAGGPGAQAFSSPTGTFRLGPVSPGVHSVWAVAEGFQPGEARRVRIARGETRRGIVLRLRASLTVRGRITDARTREPIAGAMVVPAEWGSSALADSVSAYSDANGHYALRSVPGTRNSIRAQAPGYRSILAGGIEGKPGEEIERNFELTRQPTEDRPENELTGIGAVLERRRGGIAIRELVDEGPAASQLEPGDLIVMVNGRHTARADMGKMVQSIRGEVGTEVELWVRREGEEEPRRVTITRGRVVMPSRRPRHQ